VTIFVREAGYIFLVGFFSNTVISLSRLIKTAAGDDIVKLGVKSTAPALSAGVKPVTIVIISKKQSETFPIFIKITAKPNSINLLYQIGNQNGIAF
jgi:hypothetical protein